MKDPNELSREELVEFATRVQDALYPNANKEHEWDSDTIHLISVIISDYDLEPK